MANDFELIPELVSEETDDIKYIETPKEKPNDNQGTEGIVEESIDNRVPVTILTGYLGSGKSTLLEHIAKRGDRKLAVILNEFGDSIEIEKSLTIKDQNNDFEEWLDLGNGCLCCTVKDNGVAAIERLVAKRKGFDHIILETTGLADPAPITTMFWLDNALSSNVYIDGVVTVLDSENIEKCLDDFSDDHERTHGHHDGDVTEEERNELKKAKRKGVTIAHLQIALADIILLNKIDKIENDPKKIKEVEDRIKSINGNVPIYETKFGDIDLNKILDLHAYEARDVNKLIRSESKFHDHKMSTVTLNFPKLKSNEQFERLELFLQQILWNEEADELSDEDKNKLMEIHRTKGLIYIGEDNYKVIQGVRKTYDVLDGAQEIKDLELNNSRLVFIGKNIDFKYLKNEFFKVVGLEIL